MESIQIVSHLAFFDDPQATFLHMMVTRSALEKR